MRFIDNNMREENRDRDPNTSLKVSDFVFLKEEDETRPWAREGLDIIW